METATNMNHYCPVCGQPMDAAQQERLHHDPLILLTCRTPGCKVRNCTTTPGGIERGDFTRKWKVEAAYDTLTGSRYEI